MDSNLLFYIWVKFQSNMKKFGVVLLIGAVGLYLFSRINAGKNIKAVLKKINFGGSLLSPKILITLGIQNPTSTGANVQSFTGEIYSEDKLIADISSFEKIRINPNSETIFVVTAIPQSVNIVKELIRVVKTRAKQNTFRLVGALNVDGNTLPIDFNYAL